MILVTGPTASGKTSLAIQIAKHFSTSIISADSRQCYRELNIGVAKPDEQQLAEVKHYFINSHSIHDEVNAATFAAYAHEAAESVFSTNDTVVMAGGTGLYIKAFTEGLDDIPEIPLDLRNEIRAKYQANGMQWLMEEVQKYDELYFTTGENQNPQRMMRALEVKLATGQSIKSFQKKHPDKKRTDYELKKYAIDLSREQLYQNINDRVDTMISMGLEEEARSLYPFKNLNALQTVGYSELFNYFEGNGTLFDAIEKIKQNTRHYAKRQLTWFRKDSGIVWVKDFESLQLDA